MRNELFLVLQDEEILTEKPLVNCSLVLASYGACPRIASFECYYYVSGFFRVVTSQNNEVDLINEATQPSTIIFYISLCVFRGVIERAVR